MGMPAMRRHWTAAAVRALIDESPTAWPRYELIRGALLVTPAPMQTHQLAVAELLLLLGTYLRSEPVGVVFPSPADLALEPGAITQPDIFVIPAGGAISRDGVHRWSDVRALLLAIEVISLGSIRTDRGTKREYYLEVGVPEYLVVDVDARMVEHWTPGRETPTVLRDQFEWYPTGASQPLVMSWPDFFDRIAANMRLLGGQR